MQEAQQNSSYFCRIHYIPLKMIDDSDLPLVGANSYYQHVDMERLYWFYYYGVVNRVMAAGILDVLKHPPWVIKSLLYLTIQVISCWWSCWRDKTTTILFYDVLMLVLLRITKQHCCCRCTILRYDINFHYAFIHQLYLNYVTMSITK